ncbi:uncharacterized protein [Hyperolius riggenbachi]|uniref:uncharacterized protein isoform X2 n=1 Tax=Hyperolius riggenbachi TaxID=752182 RepID=UPI0035A27155
MMHSLWSGAGTLLLLSQLPLCVVKADVHTYQIKYHCERYDDGSIGGHTDFGYNGRDFIFFDKDAVMYFPAMNSAQMLTQQWNRDRTAIQKDKEFAEKHCIDWIDKFSNILREEIKRAVLKMLFSARPEVKVWGRQQPDGVTRLQCLAYGFHPRPVDVKWVRNGEDHIPSDEASPILPHPDGTYQTRVSVEVPTREGDTYSCHVEHSSLEEPITMDLIALDFGVPKYMQVYTRGSTFKAGNRTHILPAAALLPVLAIFVVYFFVRFKNVNRNEKKSISIVSENSECVKDLDYSLLDEGIRSESRTATSASHHQSSSHRRRAHTSDPERRVGNVHWCSCRNCEIMKTEEESVCCHDYKELHVKLADIGCITYDHEFQRRYLDKDVLSLNILSSRAESSQYLHNISSRSLRFAAYTEYTHLVHGALGPGVRIPIPSCVVTQIRSHFPEAEGGSYVGFLASGISCWIYNFRKVIITAVCAYKTAPK